VRQSGEFRLGLIGQQLRTHSIIDICCRVRRQLQFLVKEK